MLERSHKDKITFKVIENIGMASENCIETP